MTCEEEKKADVADLAESGVVDVVWATDHLVNLLHVLVHVPHVGGDWQWVGHPAGG